MQIQPGSTFNSPYSRCKRDRGKQRSGNRSSGRSLTNKRTEFRHLRSILKHLSFVLLTVASTLITLQVKARVGAIGEHKPVFQAPAINMFHLPPMEMFWWSSTELQEKVGHLFATPNSIGTIALGAAEGTRTTEGQRTLIWDHHPDPGNGATNQGTFSWQLGAATPEEADLKGLARIQLEAIPHLIREAEREQLGFDLETLIQGADLWNQAPRAGADFVKNLKHCLAQEAHQTMDEVVLCARVESFYNPTTGELDASGFDDDRVWLEDDQSRRMQAIKTVLQFNQHKLALD